MGGQPALPHPLMCRCNSLTVVDRTVPAVGRGDHAQVGRRAGQMEEPLAGRSAGGPGEPDELASHPAQDVPGDDRNPSAALRSAGPPLLTMPSTRSSAMAVVPGRKDRSNRL